MRGFVPAIRPKMLRALEPRLRRALPANTRPKAPVRTKRARARSMVLGWLFFFVAFQVVLGVAVEGPLGEFRNPLQAKRDQTLRCRLREFPERPLILALGSSQSLCGLCTAQINEGLAADDPFVFNYALPSSGLFHQQTALHGLLARGIKPNGLILELATFLMPVEPTIADRPIAVYTWSEVDFIARRLQAPSVFPEWIEARSMPWYKHRQDIVRRVLPKWLPANLRVFAPWGRDTDAFGYYPNNIPADPKHIEAMRLACHSQLQYFRVASLHDAALRDMLRTCLSNGIPVLLLLPPTGPAVLSWYGPHAESTLQDYLSAIRQEFGVPVIDSRRWFPTEEEFCDSVHLTPVGAEKFTRRLAREAATFIAEVKARTRYETSPCQPVRDGAQ